MEENDPEGGGREDRRESAAETNIDITRSETSDHNSREAEIGYKGRNSPAKPGNKRERRASERKKSHD